MSYAESDGSDNDGDHDAYLQRVKAEGAANDDSDDDSSGLCVWNM